VRQIGNRAGEENRLSSQSRKPDETPRPAPDPRGSEGAYGARIDALFREAIRDLDRLKHAGETAK